MAEAKKKTNSSKSYLLYLIIMLALLAGAALLLPVYRNYQKKQAELSALEKTLAEKQAESAELNRQVGALQTSPEAVEKVAREKFGLAREGETIYRYPQPAKVKPAPQPEQP